MVRAREKVNIQVQSKEGTMLEVCTAQMEPRIAQILTCSMTCHQDELNASQQPRDQTASLCLLSSSMPRHLHNMPALWCLFSWLNPLLRTIFLFALPSEPIRKCEWLPGREVELQGGVGGSLAGRHDGCSAYNPCVYLGEPGPPERTIPNFPAELAPRT